MCLFVLACDPCFAHHVFVCVRTHAGDMSALSDYTLNTDAVVSSTSLVLKQSGEPAIATHKKSLGELLGEKTVESSFTSISIEGTVSSGEFLWLR